MKRKLLIFPLLVLFLASCSYFQPDPDDYDPVRVGIRLSLWQMELQKAYTETKPHLTEEQQEYMEEVVAPLLDEAKYMIAFYNMAVLEDEPPIYREFEIRSKLNQAASKMIKPGGEVDKNGTD